MLESIKTIIYLALVFAALIVTCSVVFDLSLR
jgi:hypothetical protein